MTVCQDCGEDRELCARGRCLRCYMRWYRRERQDSSSTAYHPDDDELIGASCNGCEGMALVPYVEFLQSGGFAGKYICAQCREEEGG